MTGWSLVTFQVPTSDTGPTSRPDTARTRDRAGVRRADGSIVVPDVLRGYRGAVEALEDWVAIAAALSLVDPGALPPQEGAVTVSTLRFPRKLLCVGANYRDHIAEMGGEVDVESWQPFFFTVPPSTTLVGDGEPILIPEDRAMKVDWEAELAVVIGRGGRDISRERAVDHIAGYACFSDITARGLLRRTHAFAEAFTWDWAGSKSLDTFCPMGAITPAWQVEDPNDLAIRCLVNGVVKQDSTTANFVTDVYDVVAAASRTWTLEPGDVIATGTPAGVGFPRGEQLSDGDEVRVEIAGLVPLTNPVVVRSPAAAAALL